MYIFADLNIGKRSTTYEFAKQTENVQPPSIDTDTNEQVFEDQHHSPAQVVSKSQSTSKCNLRTLAFILGLLFTITLLTIVVIAFANRSKASNDEVSKFAAQSVSAGNSSSPSQTTPNDTKDNSSDSTTSWIAPVVVTILVSSLVLIAMQSIFVHITK